MMTQQEAINLANEIERYESALKKMKEDLKTYVTVNGPIDTGENIWAFADSVSWKFAPDRLKDLAAEILLMGHNPWNYLKLGSPEIKALCLTDDVLKQYGTSKVTKRFASRKSEKKAVV